MDKELVLKERRVYVPKNEELKVEIIHGRRNGMVFVEDYNVFNTFSKLLTSPFKRIDSGIIGLLGSNNMVYSLYRHTSLS